MLIRHEGAVELGQRRGFVSGTEAYLEGAFFIDFQMVGKHEPVLSGVAVDPIQDGIDSVRVILLGEPGGEFPFAHQQVAPRRQNYFPIGVVAGQPKVMAVARGPERAVMGVDKPAGLEDAVHFIQREVEIRDMFKGAAGENQVEMPVGEGGFADVALDDLAGRAESLVGRHRVEADGRGRVKIFGEATDQIALHLAADVHDRFVFIVTDQRGEVFQEIHVGIHEYFGLGGLIGVDDRERGEGVSWRQCGYSAGSTSLENTCWTSSFSSISRALTCCKQQMPPS